MEGTSVRPGMGRVTHSRRRWMVAVSDTGRFVLGWFFIIFGAGLTLVGLAESLTTPGIFFVLWSTNPVIEFFVGLMGVTLGGMVIGGMSKPPQGREGTRT